MAKILGAIIAGGQSRRFGRDKASEPVDGTAMIEQVIAALRPQVDGLVICGRAWHDLTMLEDRPRPDMGPLGGLNAALHYARHQHYDAVLCVPVDILPVPNDLLERLSGPTPAVFEQQHIIGFWPVTTAALLDVHLAGDQDGSLRQWFNRCPPRKVAEPEGLRNINRPEDLPISGHQTK